MVDKKQKTETTRSNPLNKSFEKSGAGKIKKRFIEEAKKKISIHSLNINPI